jgi:hypothetical protein
LVKPLPLGPRPPLSPLPLGPLPLVRPLPLGPRPPLSPLPLGPLPLVRPLPLGPRPPLRPLPLGPRPPLRPLLSKESIESSTVANSATSSPLSASWASSRFSSAASSWNGIASMTGSRVTMLRRDSPRECVSRRAIVEISCERIFGGC